MKQIFPFPLKESLKALRMDRLLNVITIINLVNLEFLNGIWLLLGSINAEMQCPKVDKLPLIEVNS